MRAKPQAVGLKAEAKGAPRRRRRWWFPAAETGSPPVVSLAVPATDGARRRRRNHPAESHRRPIAGARRLLALVLPLRCGVDCWIGVVQEADRRIVRLAGRLGVAQVPELLRACGAPDHLQLDLTDLVSADVAGLEALQRARARGARLVGVPGYIQLKLDTPA